MKKREYQLVTMKIPIDLYNKSKIVIPEGTRTKDYIDYLTRRIAAVDKVSMIERELDEIKTRQEFLEHELELELGLKEEETKIVEEYDNIMESAIDTIRRIIDSEGIIGLDKIESIASLKDISFAELKMCLPGELQDKIVKYHPQVIGERGLEGADF